MRAARGARIIPSPLTRRAGAASTNWLDYNRQFLHNILEKDSANDPKRTPVQQKIGDMYESCMDETTVNKNGSAPLKPEFDRIAAITNRKTNWLTPLLIFILLAYRRCSILAPHLICTTPAWRLPT